MKQASLFLFFLFILMNCCAQQTVTLSSANGDCNHAVEIKDSILIASNSPEGYGSNLEISDNDKKDIHFFEREHNTVWYWFKAKVDAELSFDIIPANTNDDYDFSLYLFTDKNFCADVKSKKILPVRTCISRNDKKLKSMTGLHSAAKEEFIHSGIGASYVKSLDVKKNEIYFLLVDNVYPNGKGHTIHLHYKLKEVPFVKGLKKEIVLEEGKSFTFDNIQFYAGSAIFLPEARPALDSLLDIMRKNLTLKIEIQGHVNGPFENNNNSFQELSEQRAEAVFEFLNDNNIPSDRMTHLGFGNTRMLFPQAISEMEMQPNRRVEIKVISK